MKCIEYYKKTSVKLRQLETYSIMFDLQNKMQNKVSTLIICKVNDYLTYKLSEMGFWQSKNKIDAYIRINLEL